MTCVVSLFETVFTIIILSLYTGFLKFIYSGQFHIYFQYVNVYLYLLPLIPLHATQLHSFNILLSFLKKIGSVKVRFFVKLVCREYFYIITILCLKRHLLWEWEAFLLYQYIKIKLLDQTLLACIVTHSSNLLTDL